MSDIQKIIVPDVGGDEVEVIELCVAVGDNIEADEGVVTVESDKASMDIPAPFEGEIVSLTVSVGDKIKEGDVIGEMKVAGGDSGSAAESSSSDESSDASSNSSSSGVTSARSASVRSGSFACRSASSASMLLSSSMKPGRPDVSSTIFSAILKS